jgi:hypothetical protein
MRWGSSVITHCSRYISCKLVKCFKYDRERQTVWRYHKLTIYFSWGKEIGQKIRILVRNIVFAECGDMEVDEI